MKCSKPVQVIIFILLLLVFIYVYFIHDRATTKPVTAYLDEQEYSIYSGRNVYEYYKSKLSDKERILYDEIKECYLQFENKLSTRVDSISEEELEKTFNSLQLDHPEIFWVDSYFFYRKIFGGINTDRIIKIKSSLTEQEAIEKHKVIDKKVDEIVSKAKQYNTDIEKIKYVHDKLIQLGTFTDYDEKDFFEFQTIRSIFDTGNAVCSGYSQAFKLIMDRLGIKSIVVKYINEKDTSKSHAWNMVQIYNKWYCLDVTWDENSTKDDKISYQYFLIERDKFEETHMYVENLPE